MTAHFGNFRVGNLLGQGGWGTVFMAEALTGELRGRTVALKILHGDRCAEGPQLARFHKEAENLRRFDHANIVRILDAGEIDGQAYVAMEMLRGATLTELMKRGPQLSSAETCSLMRQVARGLSHIHAHGLVHRDIKPSNLFVTDDGTLKILDLGIACPTQELRDPASRLTGTGTFVGTLPYAAPEQQAGGLVDIRADIYSLGVVFDELLCGDGSLEKPSPPRLLRRIVDRMRRFDRSQRYRSPDEVLAALWRFERRWLVRGALATVGSIALAPAIWLGHRWLMPLRWVDHYRDGFDTLNESCWQVKLPKVDAADPQPAVLVDDGELVLRNRGYLVSREEFPDGVSVQFRWRWTVGREPKYSDHLGVAVRTEGILGSSRESFEPGDGVIVKIRPEPEPGVVIHESGQYKTADEPSPPLPRGVWQVVKIVDDREAISVYINDLAKPVANYRIPDNRRVPAPNFLAIYNREPTGGRKESHVDDLLIQVPSASAR